MYIYIYPYNNELRTYGLYALRNKTKLKVYCTYILQMASYKMHAVYMVFCLMSLFLNFYMA